MRHRNILSLKIAGKKARGASSKALVKSMKPQYFRSFDADAENRLSDLVSNLIRRVVLYNAVLTVDGMMPELLESWALGAFVTSHREVWRSRCVEDVEEHVPHKVGFCAPHAALRAVVSSLGRLVSNR